MKRYIPNILSACRILFSPFLLVPAIVRSPAIYFPLYCAVYLTDILDGKLARRLHIASAIGVKLDSVGDTLFFICAFGSVIVSPLVIETRVLVCMASVFALHFLVCVVTFVKFRVLVFTMHIYFAKLLNLALAIMIPIFVAMGRISFTAVAVYLGFTAMYTVEGIALLLESKTYQSNHRGLLYEKIIARWGESCLLNKVLRVIFC